MANLVTQLKTDINISREDFTVGVVSGTVAGLGHEDAFLSLDAVCIDASHRVISFQQQ